MSNALFRLRLTDGSKRWARGTVDAGPVTLLEPGTSLDALLAEGADALERGLQGPDGEPVPDGAALVAPVESQEVWAAGVTYERSRDARVEESEAAASAYDLVYDAPRPEIFFKAPGWRVRGSGETIGIRADSGWDVPEPELGLVLDRDGAIAGYTIGNDVSSRSIEGENPLYLPQAKIYDHSCAIGPAIVPVAHASEPFVLRMQIERAGATVFDDEASTTQMHRTTGELARYLRAALTLPAGAILLTGTTIVPEPETTLADGDVVRIAISGLGELRNAVEIVGAESADLEEDR